MRGNRFNSEGQVLLLLVMVLGTLLIVGMTAIFQTSTQTQISGINQQSQITIAAAEAALEKALLTGSGGTFQELGLTNLAGINLDQSVVEVNELPTNHFNTRKLEKDEQYTFYLSQYTPDYPYLDRQYSIGFRVFYESVSGQCDDVALAFTLVYDQNNDYVYETETFIADGGNKLDPTLTNPANTTDKDLYSCIAGDPGCDPGLVDGYQYQCVTDMIDTDNYESAKILLVRNYFGRTKLGFRTDGTSDFPPQGRSIKAIARADVAVTPQGASPTLPPRSGLTRVAEIFQSYPQLPADLWATSF